MKKKAFSMNVATMPLAKAREHALEVMGEEKFDVAFGERFDKNYALLQKRVKAAPSIPRIQMPVIEPEDIDAFQEALNSGRIDFFPPYTKGHFPEPKEMGAGESWVDLGLQDGDPTDDVIRATIQHIPAGKLLPTQNQIWFEKLIDQGIAKFGPVKQGGKLTEVTIIASADMYILDGHHRYGQVMLTDPMLKMKVLHVPLDIKELLILGRYYGEAIGNAPKQGALSAGDRVALVKMASTLPRGSETRRAILAGLAKTSYQGASALSGHAMALDRTAHLLNAAAIDLRLAGELDLSRVALDLGDRVERLVERIEELPAI